MTTTMLIGVILVGGTLWVFAVAAVVAVFRQRRANEQVLKLLGDALALVAKRDREIAELTAARGNVVWSAK